ncbi:glycoside hydrolase family 44 protein [Bdellovibrio bacteriovorus]
MKYTFALKGPIFAAIFLSSTLACSAGVERSQQPYNAVENKSVVGKITVDLTAKGQTIDRSFYGSHLDSFSKLPSPALVSELGIGAIRIGGNEFDVFNWKSNLAYTKHGVTNILGIPGAAAALNAYKVTGIYQINIHGYQPEVSNNSVVLKKSFTAESAFELIKTLNGQLNLNLVNFSLGNEFEQWHETHSHTKEFSADSGISADEYIAKYIEFAIAIRSAQEEVNGNPNSIKIWGPEISASWYDWNTGNFTTDCEYHHTIKGQVVCSYGNGKFTHFIPYFLDRLAKAEQDKTINPKGYKLLDYFSFHYYPMFRQVNGDLDSIAKDTDGRQLVGKMLEATRILHDPTYTNTIDRSSYRNVSPNIIPRMKNWLKAYYPNANLAINEFAVDSDYRTTNYHPIIRPLYIADSVAIAAKEGVAFFNNFVLNSAAGSTIPWSMIEGGNKTNIFHTYSLLANNFKGTIVKTDDNLGDIVNSYAAETANGVNLVLVNKTPIAQTVQIYLKNTSTKKVASYEVPGWSTSVLKLNKTPGVFERNFEALTYGAKEMGIALDKSYLK